MSLALLFNRVFRRAPTSRVVWRGGLSSPRMLRPLQSTHKNIKPEKKFDCVTAGLAPSYAYLVHSRLVCTLLFTLESFGNVYSLRGCFIIPCFCLAKNAGSLDFSFFPDCFLTSSTRPVLGVGAAIKGLVLISSYHFFRNL